MRFGTCVMDVGGDQGAGRVHVPPVHGRRGERRHAARDRTFRRRRLLPFPAVNASTLRPTLYGLDSSQ